MHSVGLSGITFALAERSTSSVASASRRGSSASPRVRCAARRSPRRRSGATARPVCACAFGDALPESAGTRRLTSDESRRGSHARSSLCAVFHSTGARHQFSRHRARITRAVSVGNFESLALYKHSLFKSSSSSPSSSSGLITLHILSVLCTCILSSASILQFSINVFPFLCKFSYGMPNGLYCTYHLCSVLILNFLLINCKQIIDSLFKSTLLISTPYKDLSVPNHT